MSEGLEIEINSLFQESNIPFCTINNISCNLLKINNNSNIILSIDKNLMFQALELLNFDRWDIIIRYENFEKIINYNSLNHNIILDLVDKDIKIIIEVKGE